MNQGQLTIVNCGDFHSPQVTAQGYACPAAGRNGSFKNNQYLGLCWNRAVRQIGQVRGVVDINPQTGLATVHWNNEHPDSLTDEALIQEARERLAIMFPNEERVQRVFVLGELSPTSFHKPTPGGMFQRKKYLPMQNLVPASAADLAQKLNGRTWTDYGR